MRPLSMTEEELTVGVEFYIVADPPGQSVEKRVIDSVSIGSIVEWKCIRYLECGDVVVPLPIARRVGGRTPRDAMMLNVLEIAYCGLIDSLGDGGLWRDTQERMQSVLDALKGSSDETTQEFRKLYEAYQRCSAEFEALKESIAQLEVAIEKFAGWSPRDA